MMQRRTFFAAIFGAAIALFVPLRRRWTEYRLVRSTPTETEYLIVEHEEEG
jgi:hypothetical protein